LTGNEANAGKINSWVSENTDNKINNLISGSVNAALVNAVLFDAKWVTPFGGTKSGEFTNADNSVSTVGYMSGQQGGKANQSCQYYDGRDLQAVKLDYKNGASLYVLLPREGNDGNLIPLDDKFMENLKGEWKNIQASLSKSSKEDVNLSFPKLASFEYKTDIKKNLESLLPGVLSSNNFKDILSGGTGFPIDQIIQATKLSIDEKGTSMAAATAVLSRGSNPPEMKVDHPFLLVLTLPNGDIAYMGAVKNLSGLAKAQEENKDAGEANKSAVMKGSSAEDMKLELVDFFSNNGYPALSELVDVRKVKGSSAVSVLTDKTQAQGGGLFSTYERQGFQDTKTYQNISELKVSMEKNTNGEDVFKIRLEYPSGGDPPDHLEINPKTRIVKYSVENPDGTVSFQKNFTLNKSVEKAGE